MTTESFDPTFQDLDTWPLDRILAAVIGGGRRAAEAVANAQDALVQAAAGIEGRIAQGGRLVYAGAGTSGRIAVQDAAELPPTFGFEHTVVLMAGGSHAGERALENAEDDSASAMRDARRSGIGPDDAVIGVAASGRTPYTLAIVDHARRQGAFTVGIANNPDSPLLHVAEVGVLLDTGPEVLAGSTRLAAGTAQKIALNALSTAVLVRAGGAYGNLMVGMRPINTKLQGRAIEVIAEAAGVTAVDAESALKRSEGGIREAIVMLTAGVDLDTARARLARHGQRIREALADEETP